MTEATTRPPDTEAAGYIEDDPEAWAAWLDALERFMPFRDSLTDHFRTHVTADSIIGGSILAYLADTYGLYLLRSAIDIDRLAQVLCHREHVTGMRWCRRHKDMAEVIASEYDTV